MNNWREQCGGGKIELDLGFPLYRCICRFMVVVVVEMGSLRVGGGGAFRFCLGIC